MPLPWQLHPCPELSKWLHPLRKVHTSACLPGSFLKYLLLSESFSQLPYLNCNWIPFLFWVLSLFACFCPLLRIYYHLITMYLNFPLRFIAVLCPERQSFYLFSYLLPMTAESSGTQTENDIHMHACFLDPVERCHFPKLCTVRLKSCEWFLVNVTWAEELEAPPGQVHKKLSWAVFLSLPLQQT